MVRLRTSICWILKHTLIICFPCFPVELPPAPPREFQPQVGTPRSTQHLDDLAPDFVMYLSIPTITFLDYRTLINITKTVSLVKKVYSHYSPNMSQLSFQRRIDLFRWGLNVRFGFSIAQWLGLGMFQPSEMLHLCIHLIMYHNVYKNIYTYPYDPYYIILCYIFILHHITVYIHTHIIYRVYLVGGLEHFFPWYMG